ncbi:DUF938 domain-containing protein [Marinicella sp. S1101]|uniref:DUF938 domain-containing protein n=1 Tax=Marinicella marina TaxID=2996016 RepID=UPI002260DA96|nr:DUF938 domain-containing protein [Marinicella marina]MCX7553763.1 DUF938 domain-containing protein [Marinicella marina]MDJ1140838.1 DUF938 domain-containing protein [Marinicella marina]
MSVIEKPFSPACERNQAVILEQLRELLSTTGQSILEVGTGTGQHAVYFAAKLPHIIWQTADLIEKHAGINLWLSDANLTNALPPVEYAIGHSQWPDGQYDVVYSANVLHIISEALVVLLIKDLGAHLKEAARVIFYGPFKYGGQYTADSNADFNEWLKARDPQSGIRDFAVIESLMQQQNFKLVSDITMPANNQLIVFEKS